MLISKNPTCFLKGDDKDFHSDKPQKTSTISSNLFRIEFGIIFVKKSRFNLTSPCKVLLRKEIRSSYSR